MMASDKVTHTQSNPHKATYMENWVGPTETEIAVIRCALIDKERGKAFPPKVTIGGRLMPLECFMIDRESPYGVVFVGERRTSRLTMLPMGVKGEKALVDIIATFCLAQGLTPHSENIEPHLISFLSTRLYMGTRSFIERVWRKPHGIKEAVYTEVVIRQRIAASKANPNPNPLAHNWGEPNGTTHIFPANVNDPTNSSVSLAVELAKVKDCVAGCKAAHTTSAKKHKQEFEAIWKSLGHQGKKLKSVQQHCHSLDHRCDSLSAKHDTVVAKQEAFEEAVEARLTNHGKETEELIDHKLEAFKTCILQEMQDAKRSSGAGGGDGP